MNVFLLREQALENALLAKDMAFLARQGVDEGLQAEATSVEGLDRVLPKALLLSPEPELALLVVREEGEVVVVLRVPLRHLSLSGLGHANPNPIRGGSRSGRRDFRPRDRGVGGFG